MRPIFRPSARMSERSPLAVGRASRVATLFTVFFEALLLGTGGRDSSSPSASALTDLESALASSLATVLVSDFVAGSAADFVELAALSFFGGSAFGTSGLMT